ncbi:LysR family transcriptional regulator [Antrihabitans sp. YC2-6]|nr:LysR family transcriptional regulator [Antrihabitans sp. YC2-6]
MMIRDLEWLVALAEYGHVTDTAAILGTNQPTLSRALARMEAELGTRVFERAADGIHVTPVGEIVVAAARDLTDRYEQLLRDLETILDPETGVVRLAFLDSIATSVIPAVLRSVRAEAPRVRVELRQEPGHHIIRDLDSGAVDLAILSGKPPGEFGWHPLQEDRLVLIVPPGHPFATRKSIRLDELTGEQFVMTPVGFGFRRLVDGLLREAGVVPDVSFESQDLATIEGLVAVGLGVAVVPEPSAGSSGSVSVPIAAEGARRTIGLTWRSDRKISSPAARFREIVGNSWT